MVERPSSCAADARIVVLERELGRYSPAAPVTLPSRPRNRQAQQENLPGSGSSPAYARCPSGTEAQTALTLAVAPAEYDMSGTGGSDAVGLHVERVVRRWFTIEYGSGSSGMNPSSAAVRLSHFRRSAGPPRTWLTCLSILVSALATALQSSENNRGTRHCTGP